MPGEAAVVLVPEPGGEGEKSLHHGRQGGGKGRIVY